MDFDIGNSYDNICAAQFSKQTVECSLYKEVSIAETLMKLGG